MPKKKARRNIEMYVGVHDNRWYTIEVEVADGGVKKMTEEATRELRAMLTKGKVEAAFFGVYHLGDVLDEED
jgi:hypothetical protein